jgi:hypothetical protein
VANQMLNRRRLGDQTKPGRVPPKPAGRGSEIASVSSPQLETGRCSFLSAHRLVHRQLVTTETITAFTVSDEVLIADPRGTLTPSQMVDQKLLRLLGYCPSSPHLGTEAASNREWSGRAPR